MIDMYLWTTPNGRKPLIMLEETGMAYTLKPVRLNGEQKSPEFLRINPNGRIPAIVDRTENPSGGNAGNDVLDSDVGDDDVIVFESGAILIYLAEKSGQFLPAGGQERAAVMEWLMFQMSGVGPIFGQLGHFKRSAPEQIPYAIERFENEVKRLYSVMDTRLGEAAYLAGEYSIADMATYPWANSPGYLGLSLDPYPNVKRWLAEVGDRPAVQRAMSITLE